MSIMEGAARKFLVIKAARAVKNEIEKAGMENLKLLAEGDISIVGTYLNGCSPQQKAKLRRDLRGALAAGDRMGITANMVLDELIRQLPELGPIIAGKPAYKQGELQRLVKFLQES